MPTNHVHAQRHPGRLRIPPSGHVKTATFSDNALNNNVRGKHGHAIELVRRLDLTPIEQLSQPEVELLERVYASYG